MILVRDVADFLETFAPPALAEPWDNVGLLFGDRTAAARGVLTCLTLTPDVADEAVRESAGLIVTHHPILFRGVNKLTADTAEGAMLLALARAGVAVYSPHTAFDGTSDGVNDRIAGRLILNDVTPLRPSKLLGPVIGAGRSGSLGAPLPFAEFVERVKAAFAIPIIDVVTLDRPVNKVAIGCGSGAEFLADAAAEGCDVLVTGEARFHSAVEARTAGLGLILLGHYTSERFAVEELADLISRRFEGLRVWPSRAEKDPLVRL